MNTMPLTKNNQQKTWFIIVGTINTVIDFGVFSFLVLAGLPTVLANYPAPTIALIFSFFANRHFTFRASSSKMTRQVVLFFGVTLFGLWVIQPTIIHMLEPLTTKVFNQDYLGALMAKIAATIVTLFWNFILYKRVVFKQNTNVASDKEIPIS